MLESINSGFLNCFDTNNSTLYGENGLIKNSEVMVYDSIYTNNGFDFVNMVLDNSFVSVYNFLGSSMHAENIVLTNGCRKLVIPVCGSNVIYCVDRYKKAWY
jgi:hypothetical protein